MTAWRTSKFCAGISVLFGSSRQISRKPEPHKAEQFSLGECPQIVYTADALFGILPLFEHEQGLCSRAVISICFRWHRLQLVSSALDRPLKLPGIRCLEVMKISFRTRKTFEISGLYSRLRRFQEHRLKPVPLKKVEQRGRIPERAWLPTARLIVRYLAN